ncbi:MAG TPA: beta-propeller fold lactonase family protein [Acidobacteriaceae bacterium]|nr:beta-propeller fold lactonase family protein [Acidobacteriaceae bacterium]
MRASISCSAEIVPVSLLIFLSFVIGCGGANQAGTSDNSGGGTITGTPAFTPPSSGDYLLQASDVNGVFVSTVNTSTGAVGSPVSQDTADLEGGMVVTPSNSFMYSISSGYESINGYRLVGPGLQLQNLVPGAPFLLIAAHSISSMVIHPTGNFLYIIEAFGDSYIEQYKLDATTGALTSIGIATVSSLSEFSEGVFDPQGHFLYVCDGNSIYVYQINQSTGALSPAQGSPFTVPAGGQATHLGFDSNGSFLYATLFSGGLAAFAVNGSTGALTNVAGSPFPTSQDGSTTASMAINTATNTIYVSSYPDSKITEFSIDETTGLPSLIAGSPVVVPGSAYQDGLGNLVVDPDAGVLFATIGPVKNNIVAMSIGKDTGALAVLPGAPFAGTGGRDIVHVKIP